MSAGIRGSPSKNAAFLDKFFELISKFAYDKAKDLAEKEKDVAVRGGNGGTWGGVVHCLSHFALAEKDYAAFLFLGVGQNLGQKIFGRKDLKTTYDSLMLDLQRLQDHTLRSPSSRASSPSSQESNDDNMEELLGHLCGQLAQFIKARKKTLEFYEHMSAVAHNWNMSCEDMHVKLADIISAHHKDFHHPILSPVKVTFSMECDIIMHLLQAQLKLQDVEFLPSLLHLHDANTKLSAWSEASGTLREEKRFLFGSSRQPPLPAVYQWLNRYKGLLVAKFSLYFYNVLNKQAPPHDVAKMASKCTVDLYGKVVQFHKKTDAVNVSLVLDTYNPDSQQQQNYCATGYRHPEKFQEVPKGKDSYPAIFSYPGERQDKHWPNIIMILEEKRAELSGSEKVVYFYDERFISTYFLAHIDPRITLVIIFEVKKNEKDSYVNNFLNEMCGHLRCTKLFASLKPGLK